MDATFAHDIIEKLALGIDPDSGTPLDESVFNNPTVIRALFMAKTALAAKTKSTQSATRPPAKSPNAGKKWEAADKATLRELHIAGATIRQIAAQLGRSNGGIVGQLIKEGFLKDREAGLAALHHQNTVIGLEVLK
jgi:hypothetical protein